MPFLETISRLALRLHHRVQVGKGRVGLAWGAHRRKASLQMGWPQLVKFMQCIGVSHLFCCQTSGLKKTFQISSNTIGFTHMLMHVLQS